MSKPSAPLEAGAAALAKQEFPGMGKWVGASLGFRRRWEASASACLLAFLEGAMMEPHDKYYTIGWLKRLAGGGE